MENIKIMLIGLDLSLSSSGISIAKLTRNGNQFDNKLKLFNVIFDENQRKTNAEYKPNPISNVKYIIYQMPKNVNLLDLTMDTNDFTAIEQNASTLRTLVCNSAIQKTIFDEVAEFKPQTIIVTIENFVMPTFGGATALTNISGLIMLQAYVRQIIIDLKIKGIDVKLYTPTPSQNKKFFTNKGNATKDDMRKAFVDNWDGAKIIPDAADKTKSTDSVNDVIDAISLMLNGWGEYLQLNGKRTIVNNRKLNEKQKKKRNKKIKSQSKSPVDCL